MRRISTGIFSLLSKIELVDDRDVQLPHWFRDLATSKSSPIFSYVILTIRQFFAITNRISDILLDRFRYRFLVC